jgi:hypothetical protein
MFIRGINDALGWLGVRIKEIALSLTSDQRKAMKADQDAKKKILSSYTDALTGAIGYLRGKINEEADKLVSTAQRFFDLGIIDSTEYDKRINTAKDLKTSVDPDMQNLIARFPTIFKGKTPADNLAMYQELMDQQGKLGNLTEIEQLNTLMSMDTKLARLIAVAPTSTPTSVSASDAQKTWDAKYNALVKQWTAMIAAQNALGTSKGIARALAFEKARDVKINALGERPSFAVGTANVPSNMLANVHKGETIVPANFADSLRKGDLTLSGGNGTNNGSGDTYYVTVQVQGSVQTENNLADSIANVIYKRRKQGILTV